MKRTIAILTMLILIVTAAFADFPQVSIFKLRTHVEGGVTISQANDSAMTNLGKPLYVLEVRLDVNEDENGAKQEADYFLTGDDISTENISIEFLVSQSAMTQTGESISLLITAGPLSFTDTNNETFSSNKAKLGYKEVDPENVVITADDSGENTLLVTISYLGIGRTVPANTGLFIFTAEWEATEELKAHPGVYTSAVSLTYLTE